MPRRSSYEVVLDASLFTPAQMQTVAIGRLGFQGGTRWLRDHVCSHRMLPSQYQVGLVLWALQLEYEKPLRFADADEVLVDVGARIRGPRSSQLEVETMVAGPAGVAVRTRAVWVPLRLTGDQAHSGVPARLPDSLAGRFQDDEREQSPYRSRVRALCAALEREGRRLASGTATFRVHRHHCEVADQWYWVESLGFAGAAREELVRRCGTEAPELRLALAEGIRQVDAVWLRAGQLWDLIEVRTVGYRHGDTIAFVHELGLAEDDHRGPHAIVVERI
jgi:acyl-CoA thioesterase FadM